MLDGFKVQIFQRLVLQVQPDGSVGILNLLDPGLMPYAHIKQQCVHCLHSCYGHRKDLRRN